MLSESGPSLPSWTHLGKVDPRVCNLPQILTIEAQNADQVGPVSDTLPIPTEASVGCELEVIVTGSSYRPNHVWSSQNVSIGPTWTDAWPTL